MRSFLPRISTLIGLAAVFTVGFCSTIGAVLLGPSLFAQISSQPIIQDDSSTGFSVTGYWTPLTYFPAYQGKMTYSSPQQAAATLLRANWAFTGLQSGTYDVQVTYPAMHTLTHAAAYGWTDGQTSGQATIDQTMAGTIMDGSRQWKDLGTATVARNQLTVTLTASTQGFTIADAIRINRLNSSIATPSAHPLAQGAPLPAVTAPVTRSLPGRPVPPPAANPASCADPVFASFPIVPVDMNGLQSITKDADGNIWFAEWHGNSIGKLTPAGVMTQFPVPTPGGQPWAVGAGPGGMLWFVEFAGNKIGRVNPDGHVDEFPGFADYSFLEDIKAGPDGNMWFTEWATGKVGRITPQGVITEFTIPPPPRGSAGPTSIVQGPDGAMYFTETNIGKLGRITMDGVITEFPLSDGVGGILPGDITLASDGNFLITNNTTAAAKIYRVTPQGAVIATYPMPFSVGVVSFMVSAGPDGSAWFSADAANIIGHILPDGTVKTYSVPYPSGIIWDAKGAWYLDHRTNAIVSVDDCPAASVGTQGGTGTPSPSDAAGTATAMACARQQVMTLLHFPGTTSLQWGTPQIQFVPNQNDYQIVSSVQVPASGTIVRKIFLCLVLNGNSSGTCNAQCQIQ